MTDTYTPVLNDEQIEDCMIFSDDDMGFARAIERAAIEAFRAKINQPSGFEGRCSRCWPAFCKCPAPDDEVESIKAERFLLDQELQRENRRAREFAEALKSLSTSVDSLYHKNLCDDELWLELGMLADQARQAVKLMDEPRNEDRVAAVYAQLSPSPEAAS